VRKWVFLEREIEFLPNLKEIMNWRKFGEIMKVSREVMVVVEWL